MQIPDTDRRGEEPPVQPPTLPPDFPEIPQNPDSDLQPPPPPTAQPDKVAGSAGQQSSDERGQLERQPSDSKARIEQQRRAHEDSEREERLADWRVGLPDDEEN